MQRKKPPSESKPRAEEANPTPNEDNGRSSASVVEVAQSLERQLREALGQVEVLRRGAGDSQEALRGDVERYRFEAEQMAERLARTETALRQASESLLEQQETCDELTTVLRAAEHRLSVLEKSLGEREGELSAVRGEHARAVEDAQVERTRLEGRIEELQALLQDRERDLGVQIETLARERQDLWSQVHDLEHRRQQSDQGAATARREAEELREQLSALQASARGVEAAESLEPGDLARRLPELEAAVARAREREASLAEALERSQAQRQEIERGIRQREERIAALQQEADGQRGELRRRGEALDLARSERDELARRSAELNRQIDTLRKQISDQTASATAENEEREHLSDRVRELEAAVESRQQLIGELRRDLDDMQGSRQKDESDLLALRSEIQGQSKLRQALEHELQTVRGRVSELEAQLHADAQRHLSQLAKSADRVRVLEAECDSTREQANMLRSAKEELERENERLRRRLEGEQQKLEMARLQAKLEEISSRHPNARRRAEIEAAADALAAHGEREPAKELTWPVVAFGASTGGPAALADILSRLPASFPGTIIIVQHMPAGYTAELATHLDQQSDITVVEARDGDALAPGVAFVAPGGEHLQVIGGQIRLNNGAPVNKHRPSVDVLFESLVPVAKDVHAVLLSGMGHDGAAGLAHLKERGAMTIVQDEKSSVVWGMPGAAVKLDAAQRQMSPKEMLTYLMEELVVARESTEAATGEDGAAVSAGS